MGSCFSSFRKPSFQTNQVALRGSQTPIPLSNLEQVSTGDSSLPIHPQCLQNLREMPPIQNLRQITTILHPLPLWICLLEPSLRSRTPAPTTTTMAMAMAITVAARGLRALSSLALRRTLGHYRHRLTRAPLKLPNSLPARRLTISPTSFEMISQFQRSTHLKNPWEV